jgi:hypothetical protein
VYSLESFPDVWTLLPGHGKNSYYSILSMVLEAHIQMSGVPMPMCCYGSGLGV